METRDLLEKMTRNIERVVIGKHQAVRVALVALLCEGHMLVEDVPGTGKTTLCKAIARTVGCSFRRIQLTPDVLPSDVTGLYYFDQRQASFEFRPGPIFANLVLADEINRATPRTQSALLEAMEERQVTVDSDTYPLPRPFIVVATQNPVELEGTFPLPEAQLDRFLVRTSLGYPDEADENAMVLRFGGDSPLDQLSPVVSSEELMSLQRDVKAIYLEDSVREYAVQVVRATRRHPAVRLGASPRATLALCRAAQARAMLDGRSFVIPDDVKEMAVPVLAHRMILDTQHRVRGRKAEDVLEEVIHGIRIPIEVRQAVL